MGFTHINQYRRSAYPITPPSPLTSTSTNIHPKAAAFSALLRHISANRATNEKDEKEEDDQVKQTMEEMIKREVFAIITDDWNNPYCEYITQYFTHQQSPSGLQPQHHQEATLMPQIPILAFDSHRVVESSVVDQWLLQSVGGSPSSAPLPSRVSFFPQSFSPVMTEAGISKMMAPETFCQWSLDHLQKTLQKRQEEVEIQSLGIQSEKIRCIQVRILSPFS